MAGLRKHRTGTVTSNKMDKTVVVLVERLVKHQKYKKYIRARKKFKAHDATNACHIGDQVEIVETRPLSREKRWAVVSVLRKAAE
jgi:small subunit ribosomal protein S17